MEIHVYDSFSHWMENTMNSRRQFTFFLLKVNGFFEASHVSSSFPLLPFLPLFSVHSDRLWGVIKTKNRKTCLYTRLLFKMFCQFVCATCCLCVFYVVPLFCNQLTYWWNIGKPFLFIFYFLAESANSLTCAECIDWYCATKSSSVLNWRAWKRRFFKSHWLFSIIPCVLLSSVMFYRGKQQT